MGALSGASPRLYPLNRRCPVQGRTGRSLREGAVMSRHVIVKLLAIAAVVGACAFAVPTASAMRDLASPDARPVTYNSIESSDLRSADAQDAATKPSLRSYRMPTI